MNDSVDDTHASASGEDEAKHRNMNDGHMDNEHSDEGASQSADSLSDEEINAAFASFEQEFAKDDGHESALPDDFGNIANPENTSLHPAGTQRNDNSQHAPKTDDGTDSSADNDGDELDADFQNELEGLIGDTIKVAVLITRIASADLLAALCCISDVSAQCIDSPQGAVAVLTTHDADGPEQAAQDLTNVVSGLSVVLAVNKANKLEAKLWMRGQSGEEFAPPILFASSAPFVEDIMIGTVSVDALKQDGISVVDTANLSHEQAMDIISRHMRLGPSASSDNDEA